MSELTIEKIKQMLSEVTPGKWRMINRDLEAGVYTLAEKMEDNPDTTFIVNSKEIVQFLLDKVESSQNEASSLRSRVEELEEELSISESIQDQAIKNEAFLRNLNAKYLETIKQLQEQNEFSPGDLAERYYKQVLNEKTVQHINQKIEDLELRFQAARNIALDWVISETETPNNTKEKIKIQVDKEIEEELKRLKNE